MGGKRLGRYGQTALSCPTVKKGLFIWVSLLGMASFVGGCGAGDVGAENRTGAGNPDEVGGGTGGTTGSGGTAGGGGTAGSGVTPAGLPTGPYGYVSPADVGTLVGAGSNGHPTPTETFAGGAINTPTVIENKIITDAVSVNADNVVFRNVHFRNSARTMLSVSTGVNGLTIEDSTIECTASPSESGSKQVLVGENLTNLTVRRTELTGCSRLFILDGNLDGFLWEHNVRHQVGPGFEPNGHSVGLHIAYFEPTYGNMTIRGSYFRQEDTTSYTDQISFGFSGLSNASLVVENSYFDQDLNYTIRCTANTDCAIVNTVFSASVGTAAQFENGAASFDCNRLPNGDLVGSGALIGGQANNTSCPALP